LICRWVSPFADSRSTSRILRTDNLSAAIPTPGRSPQERVASGVKVSSAAAASPSGQLRPKRVVSLLRNGWSDWTETAGQIRAKRVVRFDRNTHTTDNAGLRERSVGDGVGAHNRPSGALRLLERNPLRYGVLL